MFIFSGRSNCPKGTQCNKLAKKTRISQKIIDSAEQQIEDNGHIVDSHTKEDGEKSKKSIFSGGLKGKSDQASSTPLILAVANRQKRFNKATSIADTWDSGENEWKDTVGSLSPKHYIFWTKPERRGSPLRQDTSGSNTGRQAVGERLTR